MLGRRASRPAPLHPLPLPVPLRSPLPCPVAVPIAVSRCGPRCRVPSQSPLPCPVAVPIAVPRGAVPIAVSRGAVPIAVPRGAVPIAVPRCGRARCPHRAAAPSARCVAWHRAPSPCPVVVSRCGRARCLAAGPPGSRRHYPRALPVAHYPGGAIGTSRPTAITPAWCAPLVSPRPAPSAPVAVSPSPRRSVPWPCPVVRSPLPCPVAVGRDAWPPDLPARAAIYAREIPTPCRAKKEHKGGEPPQAFATVSPIILWFSKRAPSKTPKIFVLLYIPLKSSLCPFVLKHRALHPQNSHAHYPGGAMGTSRPTAITPTWCAPPCHTLPAQFYAKSALFYAIRGFANIPSFGMMVL